MAVCHRTVQGRAGQTISGSMNKPGSLSHSGVCGSSHCSVRRMQPPVMGTALPRHFHGGNLAPRRRTPGGGSLRSNRVSCRGVAMSIQEAPHAREQHHLDCRSGRHRPCRIGIFWAEVNNLTLQKVSRHPKSLSINPLLMMELRPRDCGNLQSRRESRAICR